jgi:hypothetical protein
MPNTLGLDDDLASAELLQNLEASFDISLSEAEAAACRAVGDVYDILRNHFSDSRDEAHRCATAMTFFRLRRAFSELGVKASDSDLVPV